MDQKDKSHLNEQLTLFPFTSESVNKNAVESSLDCATIDHEAESLSDEAQHNEVEPELAQPYVNLNEKIDDVSYESHVNEPYTLQSAGNVMVEGNINNESTEKKTFQVANNTQLTEEELFEALKKLLQSLTQHTIVAYWTIGTEIRSFYNKEYGKNNLTKISKEIDIQVGTLRKACQLASKYTKEDVEVLINGHFVMSWSIITQNLSVPPRKLIAVYKTSPTKNEFNNTIIKFRAPHENRGRSSKQSPNNSEMNRLSKRLHEQNLKNIKLKKRIKSEKEKRKRIEEKLKIEKQLNKELNSKNTDLSEMLKRTNMRIKFYNKNVEPSGKQRANKLTYTKFKKKLPNLESDHDVTINPLKSTEPPIELHRLMK